MKSSDYNYPIGKGYFSGQRIQNIPSSKDYKRDFYDDFLRYLYFMCIQNSSGEYPVSVSIERIAGELGKSTDHSKRPIKKILIGEAPPAQISGVKPINYFYNPLGKWPSSSPWITAPMNAMFPGKHFASKIDFLIACSKEGFLLLDLFPYAISYKPRGKAYTQACILAFGLPQTGNKMNQTYPHSIMNTLIWLSPCINRKLAIGFGLKILGEAVLKNTNCTNDFNNWAKKNKILLFSGGLIEELRPVPIKGASKYFRICKLAGPMGPHASLLTLAGF